MDETVMNSILGDKRIEFPPGSLPGVLPGTRPALDVIREAQEKVAELAEKMDRQTRAERAEIYELRPWAEIEPGDMVFCLGGRWVVGDRNILPSRSYRSHWNRMDKGWARWPLLHPRHDGVAPDMSPPFEVTDLVPRRIGPKAR